MGIESATISPDGTRVVFAGNYDDLSGLYVIDAEGGRPVPSRSQGEREAADLLARRDADRVPRRGTRDRGVGGERGRQRRARDPGGRPGCDGRGEPPRVVTGGRPHRDPGLHRSSGESAIYTFALDGSDLTQVVTGADSPYWSPDGSQIAYNIRCDDYRLEPSCGAGTQQVKVLPGDRRCGRLQRPDVRLRGLGPLASG